jgi:hypothetical protein
MMYMYMYVKRSICICLLHHSKPFDEFTLSYLVLYFFCKYDNIIHVNLWELLGGDLPPTNSSKGEILCVAFKRTKLYLVVAYM